MRIHIKTGNQVTTPSSGNPAAEATNERVGCQAIGLAGCLAPTTYAQGVERLLSAVAALIGWQFSKPVAFRWTAVVETEEGDAIVHPAVLYLDALAPDARQKMAFFPSCSKAVQAHHRHTPRRLRSTRHTACQRAFRHWGARSNRLSFWDCCPITSSRHLEAWSIAG